MRYDAIVAAVRDGRAEAGLLIHETALAAAGHGLHVLLDLGVWWQGLVTDVPVPLGVIVAKKSLGPQRIAAIGALIRQSLLTARDNPGLVAPLVRLFAREIDQDVIDAHVKAYVGDLSLDMGALGRAALDRLAGLRHDANSAT